MTSRPARSPSVAAAPTEPVVRLTLLSQAGELLAGSLDRRRVVALAAQLMVPRLADWVAFFPPAGHPSESGPEHVWHAEEDRLDDLAAALKSWQPVLGPAESPSQGPFGADPVPGPAGPYASGPAAAATLLSPAGPALGLPLRSRGGSLGTMVLGAPGRRAFPAAAVALAGELAARTAAALDNARLYAEQLEIVRGLQRSLLPPSLPAVPGIDTGVVYEAASAGNGAGAGVNVGGDFYEVFRISDRVWGFAIGDVCGTGPEAAALTGLARHSLRLLAREGRSPVSVVERVNQAVLEEGELAGDAGRFITMLYGELEPRPDGSAQLVLVCAGHPLPLVLRRDGTVRAAATPQPLLGVLDQPEFYAEDVELHAGEVFLAYTDGASERRNGSAMLGDEGVAAVLAGCTGMSAAGVVSRVAQAVSDFGSSATRDDLALLALRAGSVTATGTGTASA
jgi:serine phosphatase RsbU (regulator of sigma subunit)